MSAYMETKWMAATHSRSIGIGDIPRVGRQRQVRAGRRRDVASPGGSCRGWTQAVMWSFAGGAGDDV